MTRQRYAILLLCIAIAALILLGCNELDGGIRIDARATHEAAGWAERKTRTVDR